MESVAAVAHREPWNKGKIVGQKAPFKPSTCRSWGKLPPATWQSERQGGGL